MLLVWEFVPTLSEHSFCGSVGSLECGFWTVNWTLDCFHAKFSSKDIALLMHTVSLPVWMWYGMHSWIFSSRLWWHMDCQIHDPPCFGSCMHCIRQTTATKSFPEVKFEMYNSLSKQNVGRYRKKNHSTWTAVGKVVQSHCCINSVVNWWTIESYTMSNYDTYTVRIGGRTNTHWGLTMFKFSCYHWTSGSNLKSMLPSAPK